MDSTENNKRIAKNTLFLYFRMFITMLVSLYTVRVVLNTLGVVDYGIFTVVGGIVVMFSFLSNTMAAASQRFFAFDIAQNNLLQLKRTFSLTFTIYIIISFIILIFAETIGLWFLNTQMVIPSERIIAANWVYQFSIFSFMFTIMAIPYYAAIIAHEKMAIYAYISILEVIMKLIIVYLLVLYSVDKLKLYAVLMFLTTGIITFIYHLYCRSKYKETRFSFYWDKNLFKIFIGYSGWNLFGAVAGVINNQGINILLNLFFGSVVNASRGIAFQINAAINQFGTNFFTAVSPQITKYYAINEKEKMMSLVFNSSKYSYYLIFILSLPVLLETNYLLTIWLKNVPDFVVLFTRLVIINALIDSLSYSLITSALATGNIKKYQMLVGGALLLNLPISYFFLKFGFPPEITMYVSIIISIICLFLRLYMLRTLVNLSIYNYFRMVLIPVSLVTVAACFIPFLLVLQLEENFINLSIIGLITMITSLLSIYYIGFSIRERHLILKIINDKIIIKIKSYFNQV